MASWNGVARSTAQIRLALRFCALIWRVGRERDLTLYRTTMTRTNRGLLLSVMPARRSVNARVVIEPPAYALFATTKSRTCVYAVGIGRKVQQARVMSATETAKEVVYGNHC